VKGNIARIVEQFKRCWSRELEDEAIEQACREAGHKWRERELGPVATVRRAKRDILEWHQVKLQVIALPVLAAGRRGAFS
jgi:hypothetical protein